MFDFIRTHQKLMQFFLLLLILPSFAFFGLQSYNRSQDGDQGVAKVGGLAVTQQDFDNAIRQQSARMQRMMGAAFDPKIFDTPAARANVLDGLISERALQFEATRANLVVSNERVAADLASDPSVKALYGADGKLDVARYDQLLASFGLTRAQAAENRRRALLMGELTGNIPDSSFAPKVVVARLQAVLQQQRDAQELLIKPDDFKSQVKLAPDAAKKYYDEHAALFAIPEQVKVEYIVLDQSTVMARVEVKPEDEQAFYDANKKRYETSEKRRASHILIAPDSKSDADVAKAQAKAEEVLAKVKANPADFAKLAKQYSADPVSAEKGGDLDFQGRGEFVKPFEDALFSLKQGEISGLVKSDFGFHIIEMTGIKPAVIRPLSEVKGEIDAELKRQMASKIFTDSAEGFLDMVYTSPDSLKPAADKYGLAIQSADGVTRQPKPGLPATSPLANPKLLSAIFSDDSLQKKHNTAAIETSPQVLVSARVVEYKPSSAQPFDTVAANITTILTNQEAAKLAKAAGEAKLAEARKGGDVPGFGEVKTLSRAQPSGLPQEAFNAVFKADVTKLPAYAGVELVNGGYGLYRITKITQPPAGDPAQTAGLSQNIARQAGELEFNGYMAGVKKRAKVQINKSAGLDEKKPEAAQ